MMSNLLEKLKGGTLISDGRADEVAMDALANPSSFNELMAGLKNDDNVIRGRSAHALEKISRTHPEWFNAHISTIKAILGNDAVPMVRWHLVMLLTNLASDSSHEQIIDLLLSCLEDESAFVLSWAISGLCLLGRRYPQRIGEIIKSLRPLRNVQGTAIRSRATKAVDLLENPYLPIPKGWIKAK
jgi:hypothetical protein